MKKLISALLVVVMVFAFAGCVNNEPTEPEIDLPASALEILQTAWGTESPLWAATSTTWSITLPAAAP